ncbi:MAG TPA: nuclear transport factor 2 family protein [Alphaproteobacteria bacterium]|nr:nuclear transport factor 2 family protein [Alphaproteobacteria bacterium]
MSAEQNKQTALKMIATLAEGRLDESLVTPDIAWWVPGRGRVGKADFLALADAFAGLMEGPVTMKVHGVTAEGDRVAVEAESYGKLKNGKIYNNTYHFLFEFRDGKICYSKEYNDSKHAADVLGF